MIFRGRFTTRRKILLGAVLVGSAWLIYAWSAGIAITQGVDEQDLDWNGDGQVSREEVLQAFYAVVIEHSTEGNRQCRSFRWKRSGEEFRVDCKTVFDSSTE